MYRVIARRASVGRGEKPSENLILSQLDNIITQWNYIQRDFQLLNQNLPERSYFGGTIGRLTPPEQNSREVDALARLDTSC